jgi:hypothetical protein
MPIYLVCFLFILRIFATKKNQIYAKYTRKTIDCLRFCQRQYK